MATSSLARWCCFTPCSGSWPGQLVPLFVRLYFGIGDSVARLRINGLIVAGIGGLLVGLMVTVSNGLLLGQGHLAFDLRALTQLSWYALAGLALAKMLATAVTLQAGGSGGLFAPALFVGGAVGASFGALLHALLGTKGIRVEPYALVGMGALIASALGAPLTGILLVFEITGDYAIMLPLMITVAVAGVVARRLERDTLYSGWLRRRGEHIAHGASQDVLGRLRVRDVYEARAVRFAENESLTRLLERLASGDQEIFPVVDETGHLLGVITVHDLARLGREENLGELLVAADLASASETVQPEDSLMAAMRRMGQRGVAALPVVGPDGVLRGLLSRGHVLAAYDRALLEAGR